jgi:hypothetical protein
MEMGDPDFRHQQPDERRQLIPPMVLLRPRVWTTGPRYDVRHTIHWAPRIELRRLERAIECHRTMVDRLLARRTQSRIVEREQFAIQLVERGARTENARVAPAERALAAAQLPRWAPQPPELRLNLPAKRAADGPGLPERQHARRQVPAPPIDLNRLTDSVIRQIDRRLDAHRERMWKK